MRHQSESERFVSRSWDNWYLIHFKVHHPSEACEVILNVIKRSKVVLLFSDNHPVTAWLCNPVGCLSKLRICSSFPNRRTPVLSHSCSNLESGFSKLFSLVYTAIRWVWQGLNQPLTKSKKSPQLPKFQNHHFGNQCFHKKKQWGKNIIHAPINSTCRHSPSRDMTTGLATFGEDLTRLTGTVGSCTQTLCHLSQENVDIIEKYTPPGLALGC